MPMCTLLEALDKLQAAAEAEAERQDRLQRSR